MNIPFDGDIRRPGPEKLLSVDRAILAWLFSRAIIASPHQRSISIRLIGPHAQLHEALTAGANLRVKYADCADVTVILRSAEPAVTLDLERNNLEIGYPVEPPALNLATTIAQLFVKEKRATRVVRKKRNNCAVLGQQNHLLGDRFGVRLDLEVPRRQSLSQGQYLPAHRNGLGRGTRWGQTGQTDSHKAIH
jgi:hypothetical protein